MRKRRRASGGAGPGRPMGGAHPIGPRRPETVHPRRGPCHRSAAFSLIELLLVVAVIAVLSSVALPAYTDHVRRGYRADARAALLQAAQWMERAATATGSYPLTEAFPASMQQPVPGRYEIALQSPTLADHATEVDRGRTYTLVATPIGAQAGDPCGALTLTHTGARGSAGAESVQNCWNR